MTIELSESKSLNLLSSKTTKYGRILLHGYKKFQVLNEFNIFCLYIVSLPGMEC